MKAYVLGYGPKEKDPEKVPPGATTENYVAYTHEPKWVMASARQAEDDEHVTLQNMRTHVGGHYCQFSVEEQPKGGFAIVCLSHPNFPVGSHGGSV